MTAADSPSRSVVRAACGAALLGLLAAVGAGIGGCQGSTPAAAPAPAAPAADTVTLDATAQQNAGITVEPAREISRTAHLDAPGVLGLDNTQTARIGSLVDGKVLAVNAYVGDRVEAGQVLAELHSHIIHDTWAAYRRSLAERKRAQAELTFAVQANERAHRLFADKAVSPQEVERTEVDRQLAAQTVAMAETEVRRSEEAMEHLGITSGDDPRGEAGEQIPVRSPIAGAVLERMVTEGTAVTPGAPLFVVSNLSTLWALAEVDETKLPFLEVGQPVAVRVAAYPEESFPGTIIFVSDTLDPTTRRVSVRCGVPNPDGRLKPNMFATIVLGGGVPRTIVAVPADAVQEWDGKPVVFVAGDGGTFTRRNVVTGPQADGLVEIVSGLRAGERVVIAGGFLIKSELLEGAAPED